MRSVNFNLRCILFTILVLLFVSVSVEAAGKDFQDKVWSAMEALKSRKPVEREEFVNIDTKKVIFPHKKHQKLVKQLGKSCKVCHHRKKEGKSPRACKRCHAKRTVTSTGKYVRKGRFLNLKDVFHFLCSDCHKKMSKNKYLRPDGSSAKIPSKCHHCHVKK